MVQELFRSGDIAVRRLAESGSACCVVTFDSYTDFPTLDRGGFGEAFFHHSGVDAVHVISRDNRWYQYPEMIEAMALVREATRGYERVVTYGSSMGGYAAIRLAGLAGAHAALALSPQYTIDPAIVPWEYRWPHDSARFTDVWESALPPPVMDEAYVAYDASTMDRRHAALLTARFNTHEVIMPKAGHPVTGFLAEIGLLQPSILALCHGRFDPAAFTATAFAECARSPQFMLSSAERTSILRRGRRIALTREAVRLGPNNAIALCRLGRELAGAGQFTEALTLHRQALEIEPEHPVLIWLYSFSLEAAGRLDEAIEIMAELAGRTADRNHYKARLMDLLRRRKGRPWHRWLGARKARRRI